MSTYVVPGPFKSREEIEVYFSGDKIACLLCGRQFRNVSQHLRLAHDTTAEAYKEMFGLPASRGLVSDALHERMSQFGRENIEKRGDEWLAAAERGKANRGKPYSVHRPVAAHTAQRREHGTRVIRLATAAASERAVTQCGKCGSEVETSRAYVSSGRAVYCSSCRPEKLREWARSRPPRDWRFRQTGQYPEREQRRMAKGQLYGVEKRIVDLIASGVVTLSRIRAVIMALEPSRRPKGVKSAVSRLKIGNVIYAVERGVYAVVEPPAKPPTAEAAE